MRNGSILLNMRSGADVHARIQSRSDDGGSTFVKPWEVASLPDPVCNGGLATLSAGTIALSHDATATSRSNMSLFLSTSDGNTWDSGRVLWRDASAYSTLTPLSRVRGGKTAPQELAVLYERGSGEAQRYANITLAVLAA